MATIKIPPVLRGSVGGEKEVEASGSDVGEVLRSLASQHPETESQLFSEDGELNRYVNVYLNDEDVRVLDGLDTSVSERRHRRDPAGDGRRRPLIRPARPPRGQGRLDAASGSTRRGPGSPRSCPRGTSTRRRRAGCGSSCWRTRTCPCSWPRTTAAAARLRGLRHEPRSRSPARGGRGAEHVRGLLGVAPRRGQGTDGRGARRPARAWLHRGRGLVLRRQRPRERVLRADGLQRDGTERSNEVWAHIPEVRYRRSL